MAEVDGVLVIDKPEGITSHDVVERVRHRLRMKRIGHTGTLDPLATGILVLLLGKATRLQQFLVGCDKEYIARIRLGFATDTYDRTGKPQTPIIASDQVMVEQIQQVLQTLRGLREQVPPMFSAKKQAGRRLYHLARRGQEVPRAPVRIHIHALELLPEEGEILQRHADGTSDFSLLIRCSAGAYIRSLAHEIGQRLGCGGHLLALRRTAVGDIRLEQALTLEEFEHLTQLDQVRRRLIPLAHIPLNMPTITLTPAEAERLRHGQAVTLPQAIVGRYCKLIDGQGGLMAVGELMSGGVIQPRVVLC